MAWYHAQFTSRRFHPNPVSLTTLPATTTPSTKTNPTPDALFGPPIGPVPPAPAWTTAAAHTPKRLVDADELTPDTVRTWIEKSKLPSTPTTTLQAQVNLRRPTLRLAPLTDVRALRADGVHLKDAPHLLAFQFDCAAPQCGVHVHVLLPAAHPDAPAHGGPLRVFEAVVPGGFGRTLGAADGAVLELARFERMPAVASGAAGSADAETDVGAAKAQAQGQTQAERKRFTPFHFRRRAANASAVSSTGTGSTALPATGAPLAVVDANAPPAAEAAAAAHNGGKADAAGDDSGVRVTIRLVALDAQGKELEAPNEQTVYLVVGRLGAPHPAPTTAATDDAPADARTSSSEADEDKKSDTDATEDAEDKDPDTRAWLVRVVRREATIGPHTFALHEIYGLGAGGATTQAPAAAAGDATTGTTTPMTYPPQPPAPADDPVERECLLCLSAAREVVLLPCRHLVACRPCAVNMVEFGAGGAIVAEAAAVEAEVVVEPVVEPVPVPEVPAVQGEGEGAAAEGEGEGEAPAEGEAEAEAEAEGEAAAAGAGTATTEAAPTVSAPTPTPTPAPAPALVTATTPATTTRRKRKAKGWFCPVCRQPYTSLLRITTAPPPAAGSALPLSPTSPANASANPSANGNSGGAGGEEDAGATTTGGGGLLGGLSGLRPAFLRGLSRAGPPRDVEAQA